MEVLALDSIYKILTADERIMLHRWDHAHRSTDKILSLILWIDENGWKSPFMKYPEFDKDQLYFENQTGDFFLIESYQRLHPEITEQILNLKYNTNAN